MHIPVAAMPYPRNRVLVLPLILSREKILGIPSIQKGFGADQGYRAANVLYEKSHAKLDQSSLQPGSLSAQNLA